MDRKPDLSLSLISLRRLTSLPRFFFPLCLFAALTCAHAAAAAAASPAITVGEKEEEIERGDIDVFVRVTGLSTVQDTYDVYAPFDGRIEEVLAELFTLVAPDTILAHMVSTEMAALLDSSTGDSKKQTEKRWKNVYDYYTIKPEFKGVLTNIYVKPKDRIYKGSRLFTVARKVVIIGKNAEPLYAKLSNNMTAELVYTKDPDIKLKALLTNFIRIKDSPYFNRLWLEVTELKTGLRIGEQFTGFLAIGRSEDTLLVPRDALFEKLGRRYLIMEVETGLSDDKKTEVLKPGLHYLKPVFPQEEQQDGKVKKTD